MAHTKHSMEKRVEWRQSEVHRREPKVQKERRERRKLKFRLGTKALREIHEFQKLTELLILKTAFYR